MLYFRYYADPSGAFFAFKAKAIGSGSEGAQTELQDQYHQVTNHIKYIAHY
jgi:20S proteasome subunit alpha 5